MMSDEGTQSACEVMVNVGVWIRDRVALEPGSRRHLTTTGGLLLFTRDVGKEAVGGVTQDIPEMGFGDREGPDRFSVGADARDERSGKIGSKKDAVADFWQTGEVILR